MAIRVTKKVVAVIIGRVPGKYFTGPIIIVVIIIVYNSRLTHSTVLCIIIMVKVKTEYV